MDPKQPNDPNALAKMYAEAHAEAYRSYLRILKQHLSDMDIDALDLSTPPAGIALNFPCMVPMPNFPCMGGRTNTPETSSSQDDAGESA